MRVSYNWLKEYVDIPWPVEELAGRLTMAGLLVEQMEPMSRDLDDIVVAEVLDVAPHPAAGQLGGTVIQRAELRGVVSEGMLGSEAELGTGDDADGIWLLPPDVRHGRPLVEELGLDDVILHLEVYPNRPDCLSVIGVAR